jgi:hypothetical protein
VSRSRLQGNGAQRCRTNFLLNLLEPHILDQIEHQLSIIRLLREQVLAKRISGIERVYFPHSGIKGGAIEPGMIA